jgi:hypothetical protein
VENIISAAHYFGDQFTIFNAALDNLHPWIFRRGGEIPAGAPHEIVQHYDFAHRLSEQLIDDVRADKTGPAHDQHA